MLIVEAGDTISSTTSVTSITSSTNTVETFDLSTPTYISGSRGVTLDNVFYVIGSVDVKGI